MKTFRDLYLRLNDVDIEQLSVCLVHHCLPPWRRRADKDGDLALFASKPLCFESEGDENISPAALFLFPKSERIWYVSNIVPTATSELTYDQYNSILENFFKKVVSPAIEGLGVTAELTSEIITIGGVAGVEVEKALIRFSNLVNKSTGSSHPLDRERWFEFLMLVNEKNSELQVDLVIRSLIELGWREDKADELGIQFEFAEGLLSYAQRR